MRPIHLLAALAMTLVFGLGWVVAKNALDHFPPILLAGFRFAVAALVLIGLAPPPRGHIRKLATISVLAITVPYAMSYVAMRDLDVASAVLLAQMEAPVLILAGAVLLGEKPSFRQIIGISVAVGGVVLVAGDPKLRDNGLAVALALGSIATWAVGQIRVRKMADIGGMRILAWLSLFGAPQLFAASLLLESDQTAAISTASPGAWLAVLYLGVVMTACGIGIWYQLIGRYPVAQVSPFLLLVPVVSIVAGILFLGEMPGHRQVVGGTLIMLGVGAIIFQRHAETDGRRGRGCERVD